ncbi:MAG: hypothetical protein RL701_1100, partial [Pseudomonadota bacterium]
VAGGFLASAVYTQLVPSNLTALANAER